MKASMWTALDVKTLGAIGPTIMRARRQRAALQTHHLVDLFIVILV